MWMAYRQLIDSYINTGTLLELNESEFICMLEIYLTKRSRNGLLYLVNKARMQCAKIKHAK